MSNHLEATFILPIPELEAVVSSWRNDHDWTARWGLPAHVTLVGGTNLPSPWAKDVPAKLPELEQLVAGLPAVDISFRACGRYEGALFVAVEATDALAELAVTTARVFDLEPRNRFHLTVARGDIDVLDVAQREIELRLPIVTAPSRVLVMTHRDDLESFEPLAELALGLHRHGAPSAT